LRLSLQEPWSQMQIEPHRQLDQLILAVQTARLSNPHQRNKADDVNSTGD
jgi:hypothetical protein